MKPDRTVALGLALVGILAAGAVVLLRWPSTAPALDCPPDEVRFVDAGTATLAVCAKPGSPQQVRPGVGQALTVGQKLDLNTVSEAELARVPGVGKALAHSLIEARTKQGGFRSWDDVDQVRGVGPSKLDALQQAAELHR